MKCYSRFFSVLFQNFPVNLYIPLINMYIYGIISLLRDNDFYIRTLAVKNTLRRIRFILVSVVYSTKFGLKTPCP